MPDGWLGRLSIGKKLALSFSVIPILLIGSLSASLFYAHMGCSEHAAIQLARLSRLLRQERLLTPFSPPRRTQ